MSNLKSQIRSRCWTLVKVLTSRVHDTFLPTLSLLFPLRKSSPLQGINSTQREDRLDDKLDVIFHWVLISVFWIQVLI